MATNQCKASRNITVFEAAEGFRAIIALAQVRDIESCTEQRRLADEQEIVRLYRASVYGGDGRQQILNKFDRQPYIGQ